MKGIIRIFIGLILLNFGYDMGQWIIIILSLLLLFSGATAALTWLINLIAETKHPDEQSRQ
ncbi:hypothetical protein SAMN05660330_03721 [Desulforhopalus singaporensis]|uniref:Uncharacterized protein n=1 Tax=Desulforhopalus singaporensis TaxID=91360 RepID=A0A1H0UU63_9BACT|nr:hypothetical protein SAMN05660330_03721 [Desulforhopalus singaporensis]